jgi:hypothetical protein
LSMTRSARSHLPTQATVSRAWVDTLGARPEQARAGPALGRSHLGESERRDATLSPRRLHRCRSDQLPASARSRTAGRPTSEPFVRGNAGTWRRPYSWAWRPAFAPGAICATVPRNRIRGTGPSTRIEVLR